MDIYAILKPHFESLLNFKFVASNPLFWGLLCVLCLILARFWEPKKALSFCCVIGILLLAATKAESIIVDFVSKSGETFDPIISRVFFVVILGFVFIYYLFIK